MLAQASKPATAAATNSFRRMIRFLLIQRVKEKVP
jgi:hypothetical protein